MIAGYAAVCAAAKDPKTFSYRYDMPNGSSPYSGSWCPGTSLGTVQDVRNRLRIGQDPCHRSNATPRGSTTNLELVRRLGRTPKSAPVAATLSDSRRQLQQDPSLQFLRRRPYGSDCLPHIRYRPRHGRG